MSPRPLKLGNRGRASIIGCFAAVALSVFAAGSWANDASSAHSRITSGSGAQQNARANTDVCPTSTHSGFRLVCGQDKPEDIVRIPNTDWIVTSGWSPGAGIALFNVKSKHFEHPFRGAAGQVDWDAKLYPECPGPVNAALFAAQGLSLRRVGDNVYRLYVVNHGGRNSIEVFSVNAAARAPSIVWRGCLDLPAKFATVDGVASNSSGDIFFSVLTRPGDTFADFVEREDTGGVYEWTRGARGYRLVPGTFLPGDNGLAVSPDGKWLFVVAFGLHSVVRVSLVDPKLPAVRAQAPGFMPDNIHWYHGELLAAGMKYDEPACGGLRKVVDGRADPMLCHRGFVVATLDPKSMTFRVVAYSLPNPNYNGVSTGLLMGDTLWISSYQSNGLLYRALPWVH